MIAIVAAGQGREVAALGAACATVAPTTIWQPGRLRGGGWAGRHAGLTAVAVAARAWAGHDAERLIRADIAQRALLDHWAARQVRRHRPQLVIASSLAARHTLAAAREVGARTVLLLDLPLLRLLGRDLDRAAQALPERRFLRRVRPASAWIATQEAELVLAELVLVRGPYAQQALIDRGMPVRLLAAAPRAIPPVLPTTTMGRTGRVRLAGAATARHGLDLARAVAVARGLTLVVRIGDGTEPADLARWPGIATDDGAVDAVLAPTLCEAYLPELWAARLAGLPTVASPQAALAGDVGFDPFDADGVGRALDAALAEPAAPVVPHGEATQRLRALLNIGAGAPPPSTMSMAVSCPV